MALIESNTAKFTIRYNSEDLSWTMINHQTGEVIYPKDPHNPCELCKMINFCDFCDREDRCSVLS
jgi:hypothetical protein